MKANCTLKSSHKYLLLCPYRGSKPTFLVQIPDWVPDPCSSGHLPGHSLSPALTFKLLLTLQAFLATRSSPLRAVQHTPLLCSAPLYPANRCRNPASEPSYWDFTPLLWPWARDTVLSGLDNSGPLWPRPVSLCCLNLQTFMAVFIWLHAWNVHRGQWFSIVAVHWNHVGNLEK